MQVIDHLKDFPKIPYTVVTSGMFDGVHFGHKEILHQLIRKSKVQGGKSVVITYWPHPRFVLTNDTDNLKLLTTFDEKVKLLNDLGVDFLVKIPFTREFSELEATDFVRKILIEQIDTKKLVIGYNHRFGRDKSGSFEYLMNHQDEFSFEIEEIPRQDIEHVGVSSTMIRNALADGDIPMANEYLGRQYSISGIITKGEQIGRNIGFPTANIYIPETYKLVPADGAYAVEVLLNGKRLNAMLNIGVRPTVGGNTRTIEAHIFDFDKEVYGQSITVFFVSQLRKERKFDGLDELKEQLIKDKKSALQILM